LKQNKNSGLFEDVLDQPAMEASARALKHRSSAAATRWWCNDCGSFISMDYNEEHTVRAQTVIALLRPQSPHFNLKILTPETLQERETR
jgi:hypothetical protein